jgi:hypothetical protein
MYLRRRMWIYTRLLDMLPDRRDCSRRRGDQGYADRLRRRMHHVEKLRDDLERQR